mmetsp:Transcript_38717/g.90001  ORF Transcript_38717/g.90001 Transcript_38717/m.90001 type:complete len:231 (-) Transcript_38717:4069-4761(-)
MYILASLKCCIFPIVPVTVWKCLRRQAKILAKYFLPTFFSHKIDTNKATRIGISECSMSYRPDSQIDGLLFCHFISFLCHIQNSKGVGATRPHGKNIPSDSCPHIVNIIYVWTSGVITNDHSSDRQTNGSSFVQGVREDAGSTGYHHFSAVIIHFVGSNNRLQLPYPEAAVSSTSRHGTQYVRTDRQYLLGSFGANKLTDTCPRIYSDNYTSFENEGESSGAMGKFKRRR